MFASWFTSAPKASPKQQQAENAFSANEVQQMHAEWASLTKTKTAAATPTDFLRWLNLPAHVDHRWWSTQLLNCISGPNAVYVTFEDYIVAKAECLKQGEDVAAQFVFGLLSAGTQTLPHSALVQGIAAAAAIALGMAVADTAFVEATAAGVIKEFGEGNALHLAGLQKMNKTQPALVTSLRQVMVQSFDKAGSVHNGAPSPTGFTAVPALVYSDHGGALGPPKGPVLLSSAWAWWLSAGLNPTERLQWQLLYNSDMHGKSHSTMLAKVKDQGSTLMLLKDSKGHVSCGFASQPWAKSGKFYGDFRCFVAQLLPLTLIYRPSGANSNFQYCGINNTNLPNGFGWGGQEGYYGLFLDSTMDKGMSRPCATYANTCLMSQEVFDVEVVEVWLVEPLERDEDEPKQNGKQTGTVMDRMKEEYKWLQVAGVATDDSAAYRKVEPIETD